MEAKLKNSYVCLDLETTGLEPKKDKIIEIGAVRVRDGEICARMESLVNPGICLSEHITELTGIHDEELRTAPQITEILPELLAFIGTDILLGHRVLFDYSFVKKAAVNQRLMFEKKGIDTLKIARKFLPELESRSLPFLCRYFGIAHNAHRALDDAEAAEALYRKLAELFYTGHEEDFEPHPLIYHAKREQPATVPQKEQLYKWMDRHRIEIGCDVEKLTRSEASRLMSRLLVKYGR